MEPPGRSSMQLDAEYELDSAYSDDTYESVFASEQHDEMIQSNHDKRDGHHGDEIADSDDVNIGDRTDFSNEDKEGENTSIESVQKANDSKEQTTYDGDTFSDACEETAAKPSQAEVNEDAAEATAVPFSATKSSQPPENITSEHSKDVSSDSAAEMTTAPYASRRSNGAADNFNMSLHSNIAVLSNPPHSLVSSGLSMMSRPDPNLLHCKDQCRDVVEQPLFVHVITPMDAPTTSHEISSSTAYASAAMARPSPPDSVQHQHASASHYSMQGTTPTSNLADTMQHSSTRDPSIPNDPMQSDSMEGSMPPPSLTAVQQRGDVAVDAMPMTDDDAALQLMKEGFPSGLAYELLKARDLFPLRLWVVDNSGSMLNSDCTRVVEMDDGNVDVIKCNRWNELQSTVQRQAHFARIIGAKTMFRMLNKSRRPGAVHEFMVHTLQTEVEYASTVMASARPDGVTPITNHVIEIHNHIASLQEDLLAMGQKVVVVIATDGIPTDKYGDSPMEVQTEFGDALKRLQTLPVWIVLRLCTTEKEVIKFYRKMDGQLERPLECISNFTNEGKEVRACNSWLNYALPLHRSREMGYHHRVFDLLDERELTIEELREFLDALFGPIALANAPDIHADWKGFHAYLTTVVRGAGRQWCPHSKKLEDWIDLRKLSLIYGGGFVGSIRRRVSDMKISAK